MEADSGGEGMFCSGCGGAMTDTRYLNVPVDACDACGGTWLEEGPLKWIIEIGPKSLPSDRVKQLTTYSRAMAPRHRLREDDTRPIVKCPYSSGIIRPGHFSANCAASTHK